MKAGYFVAGTDTGVGKTRTTCTLLHAFARLGHSTLGMKPVAAGCERHGDVWQNEDVEALIAASSVVADRRLINPYTLRTAIAPHLAAERQGVNLRIAPIRDAFEQLALKADIILVEGAGGWSVPLDDHHDMSDLAIALGLPVILVVGMRLGCISHALLTAEAIAHRGLKLAAWIANDLGTGMAAYSENLATLQARLPAPLLAELPWKPNQQTIDAAQIVSLKRLSDLLAKTSAYL